MRNYVETAFVTAAIAAVLSYFGCWGAGEETQPRHHGETVNMAEPYGLETGASSFGGSGRAGEDVHVGTSGSAVENWDPGQIQSGGGQPISGQEGMIGTNKMGTTTNPESVPVDDRPMPIQSDDPASDEYTQGQGNSSKGYTRETVPHANERSWQTFGTQRRGDAPVTRQ